MGVEILLDTPALLVRRRRHPSRAAVVTFHHYAEDPAAVRTGFCEGALDALRTDAIHVISRANDWFGNDDMPRAAAAIRAALAGKRAITCGSSMGGYGALRFAGAVGAARAFALSPQYSLDPAVVPFETRWRPERAQFRVRPWPEAAPPPPAVIIFDPRDGPDARHVALWAAERAVLPVPIPHAGHPATTILAELRLLVPAILDVLEDRFDLAALLAAVRRGRRGSAEYFATLADAQPPCRAAWKLRLMRRAVTLAPDAAHLVSRRAMLLYRAGRDAEADRAHRRALRLAPDDPLILVRRGIFLRRVGRYEEALAFAERAARLRPDADAYARHLRRARQLAGPPGPTRLVLRLLERATRALDRRAFTRADLPWGRLATP